MLVHSSPTRMDVPDSGAERGHKRATDIQKYPLLCMANGQHGVTMKPAWSDDEAASDHLVALRKQASMHWYFERPIVPVERSTNAYVLVSPRGKCATASAGCACLNLWEVYVDLRVWLSRERRFHPMTYFVCAHKCRCNAEIGNHTLQARVRAVTTE